jgi:hypothetical protein
MAARAWPGTPPHDGVRLFLPALGFWCVLAGVGTQRLWDAAAVLTSQRRLVARAALAAAIAVCAVPTVRYYPHDLSHYNALVGGVRGAAALGFEPTYWWDSLDRDVLDWLNEHTGADERVAFSSIANVSLIRSWGWLHPVQSDRSGRFRWYVFQNRTSFLADSDRYLIEHEAPAFLRYPGGGSPGSVAADLDVPLLFVYSYEQYQAARQAVTRADRGAAPASEDPSVPPR